MAKTTLGEPISLPSAVRCRQTDPVCLSCEDNPALPRSQPIAGISQKQERLPDQVGEPFEFSFYSSSLVGALRKEGHENHQIREREKPLIRIDAGSFRGPRDKSQVAALCKVVHVLHANPRQVRNFRIGENLLTRLHGDHGPTPQLQSPLPLMLQRSYALHLFPSNSRSVL